mmetsp:Transcript_3980/g.9747  ORF Transcript_3980/g.9747 Transcript_3980/m.9747 type:complete len:98 (-) Transcript_3980:427-720(-)
MAQGGKAQQPSRKAVERYFVHTGGFKACRSQGVGYSNWRRGDSDVRYAVRVAFLPSLAETRRWSLQWEVHGLGVRHFRRAECAPLFWRPPARRANRL